MKIVFFLLCLSWLGQLKAETCPAFTMQFVNTERLVDAERRLGTADFDIVNDTKHTLIEYQYSKNEAQILKRVIARYTPSQSGLELDKEFHDPAVIRAFFNIEVSTETIDVIGVHDVVDNERYLGTTKSQVLGLLTQLDNLINNDAETAKAMRSVADLYGKTDEVKHELSVIRRIINRAN